MGAILQANATVTCTHGGTATPGSPSMRVRVSSQGAVTQPTLYTVSVCTFTTPAGNPMPCITAQWTSGATRVRSEGQALLLQDSRATTAPNGVSLSVSANQTRVTAE